MENFTIIRRAGHGAQGVVHKALDGRTGEFVAIKMIDVTSLDKQAQEAALAEVRVLETLKDEPHPCIMRYRTSFIHDGHICLVLDWCDGGTLLDVVEAGKQTNVRQSEEFVWAAAISMLSALAHCHSRGILHRDVKLANVFLHREGGGVPRFMLGDFGVSCVLGDRSRARTMVGTPYYLSPELCNGEPYDGRSDMWAFGVALFHLCNDKLPFEASNYAALIMQIVRAKAAPASRHYSVELRAVAAKCMRKRPETRPTAEEALRSSEVKAAASRVGLAHLLPATVEQLKSVDAGPSLPTLPMRRPVVGAVPSRRVRNKNQVLATSTAPKTTTRPVIRPMSGTQTRKNVRVEPSTPAAEPSPVSRKLSEAARERAAKAVAALPDFGSDSGESDADRSCADRDEAAGTSPKNSSVGSDASASGESPSAAVTWKVDGEEGTSAALAPMPPESCTASESESPQSENEDAGDVASQLAVVQDEAERLVDPARFIELVDALRHPEGGDAFFREISAVDARVADELTYLCYRYVLLSPESE